MDVTLIGEHTLTNAEVMESRTFDLDPRWAEHLFLMIDRQSRERVAPIHIDPGKRLTLFARIDARVGDPYMVTYETPRHYADTRSRNNQSVRTSSF
jgi:hypothetical protein